MISVSVHNEKNGDNETLTDYRTRNCEEFGYVTSCAVYLPRKRCFTLNGSFCNHHLETSSLQDGCSVYMLAIMEIFQLVLAHRILNLFYEGITNLLYKKINL